MDTEETRLIARVQARDPVALGEVYDRYATRIYTYLYHRLGDRPLAEDLTSEVFVRMLEAAQSRRFAHTSLSGWLYRIARNLVVDHHRRRSETVPLDEELVEPEAGPAGTVEARLAQDELRAALQHLTEDQRQVIVLRFGEGLTAKQVAEVLSKPETAVWSLQHRALARLQRVMAGAKS